MVWVHFSLIVKELSLMDQLHYQGILFFVVLFNRITLFSRDLITFIIYLLLVSVSSEPIAHETLLLNSFYHISKRLLTTFVVDPWRHSSKASAASTSDSIKFKSSLIAKSKIIIIIRKSSWLSHLWNLCFW